MTLTPDLAAKGRVLRADSELLVFHPLETNYEHHLTPTVPFTGPVGRNLRGAVRVRARKIYTVPSGGNFVQPVIGSPRIIQGRVLSLSEKEIVVKAGGVFVCELPTGNDTLDLHNGDIQVNALVNVVAWPGATLEVI